MPTLKNYLVVINKYETNKPTPRIRSVCMILKAEHVPTTKELKQQFHRAVINAIKNTPQEYKALLTDPKYRVTWNDVHKLPGKYLAEQGLSHYDSRQLPGFNDVIIMNVEVHGEFDLTEVIPA